jgi:lipopolysaccharide export system protein LptA
MTPNAASFKSSSIAILAVALVSWLAPGTASAKTSDRNQQTRISAASNDCSLEESGPCIFSGDVRINQGTLDISAGKADLRRANGEIQSVQLSGGTVKLKQQNDDGGWVNASAAQIDYDLTKDTVVLSGNAVVNQPGRGSISGERIIYNMRTSQVQSGAAAGDTGGRVNMTFEPKNKVPAKDAGTAPKAEPPKQDEN